MEPNESLPCITYCCVQMGIAHQKGCSWDEWVLQGPTHCKRFTQVYGVDYYETFAPVTKLASIRTILAIAAGNNWPIDRFDFHSAFLNGQLKEDQEVLMEQPPGYEESDSQKYWIKLYKSIYGLKQARCKWYKIMCRTHTELGFKKCEANQAIFYIHAGKNILISAIHVNDCTITWSSHDPWFNSNL